MRYPYSHAWTRAQKWDIITGAAVAILVLAASIFVYERFYRGPSDKTFYGMWEAVNFLPDETLCFRFNADQTFNAGDVIDGAFTDFFDGRWYAGGRNFYLRFNADDIGASQRVHVFRFVDIQAGEFRLGRDAQVCTFRRISLQSQPNASNQALEATATR